MDATVIPIGAGDFCLVPNGPRDKAGIFELACAITGQQTPRPDPSKATRQGGCVSPGTPARPLQAVDCGGCAPPVYASPLTTGSIWDHDALCAAVADYKDSRLREDYLALRLAAGRCGLPDGEPPLAWAERRVASYRNLMGVGQ